MDGMTDAAAASAEPMPRFEDGSINLRELPGQLAERVASETMGAEADQLCAATHNGRSGYRERSLVTCVGTPAPGMPRLRNSSFFPDDVTGRCRRVDRAVVAAVPETCVTGTSARKAGRVAQAMGTRRLPEDRVSAMVANLDGEAGELAARPLGTTRTPYLLTWMMAGFSVAVAATLGIAVVPFVEHRVIEGKRLWRATLFHVGLAN